MVIYCARIWAGLIFMLLAFNFVTSGQALPYSQAVASLYIMPNHTGILFNENNLSGIKPNLEFINSIQDSNSFIIERASNRLNGFYYNRYLNQSYIERLKQQIAKAKIDYELVSPVEKLTINNFKLVIFDSNLAPAETADLTFKRIIKTNNSDLFINLSAHEQNGDGFYKTKYFYQLAADETRVLKIEFYLKNDETWEIKFNLLTPEIINEGGITTQGIFERITDLMEQKLPWQVRAKRYSSTVWKDCNLTLKQQFLLHLQKNYPKIKIVAAYIKNYPPIDLVFGEKINLKDIAHLTKNIEYKTIAVTKTKLNQLNTNIANLDYVDKNWFLLKSEAGLILTSTQALASNHLLRFLARGQTVATSSINPAEWLIEHINNTKPSAACAKIFALN